MAKTLIPKLCAIFDRHEIPHTIKPENGLPSNDNDLKPTQQNWVPDTRHRDQIDHKVTQKPKHSRSPRAKQ